MFERELEWGACGRCVLGRSHQRALRKYCIFTFRRKSTSEKVWHSHSFSFLTLISLTLSKYGASGGSWGCSERIAPGYAIHCLPSEWLVEDDWFCCRVLQGRTHLPSLHVEGEQTQMRGRGRGMEQSLLFLSDLHHLRRAPARLEIRNLSGISLHITQQFKKVGMTLLLRFFMLNVVLVAKPR